MVAWFEHLIQKWALRYVAGKVGLTPEQFALIEDEVWAFIKMLSGQFGVKRTGVYLKAIIERNDRDPNMTREALERVLEYKHGA